MKKAFLRVLAVPALVLLPVLAAAEDRTASTVVSVPSAEASCLPFDTSGEQAAPVSSPALLAAAGESADAGCCSLAADACAAVCSRCGVLVFQCVRVSATACVPACACRTCPST